MSPAILTRVCAAVAVSAALVAGAATAATAASARPARPASVVKPLSTNVILVQKSIGGIRLGESVAAARKGFSATDCAGYQCTYVGAGYTVAFTFAAPKPHAKVVVNAVSLYADKPRTTATKVRTRAGIGLESTAAAVHKAYPKAYGSAKTGYFRIGSGKANTVATLFLLGKDKKVDQIAIAVQRAG